MMLTSEQIAANMDADECEDSAAAMMPMFDAILALATDTWGPLEVVKMLREKADLIEAISTRMMH